MFVLVAFCLVVLWGKWNGACILQHGVCGHSHYLERLRAGELPNALVEEEEGSNRPRRRSSATQSRRQQQPPPQVDTTTQRRRSGIEEFEQRAGLSMMDPVDIEAPMAEVVAISSPYAKSPGSDPRRSSRVYGSSSSRVQQQQQEQEFYQQQLEYEADRRLSINALAELTALEAALEESKVLCVVVFLFAIAVRC